MTDHQFKIRIKLQQPAPQSIEQQYPETAEQIDAEPPLYQSWDWHKISVALLIVGSLLGLLSYVLFNWNDDTSELTETHIVTETNATADEKITMPSENQIEHTEIEDTKIIERNEDNIQFAPTDHTIPPQPKPDSDADTYADPYPFPQPKPILLPEENITAEVLSETPGLSNALQADHPQIARAQLSHAVQAREPIDSINHIQLDQNTSKPIYFFIQLNDLTGQSVNVDWYYENEMITTKTLQIGGENWRTYASKMINKNQLGSWRAVLTDLSGNQMAERHFTVSIGP
ncbi:MAG: DUF2914 domain-containing protein [Betaproteobacteria bacterium]|nr:DUF2914 domain-containing protein [Betaproteobacteria bacterium]